MSILNRDLVFLLDCAAVLGFPFADQVLCSLPVAEFQRLAQVFPAKCSVNPNGALAVSVFPTPLRVACSSCGDDDRWSASWNTPTGRRTLMIDDNELVRPQFEECAA